MLYSAYATGTPPANVFSTTIMPQARKQEMRDDPTMIAPKARQRVKQPREYGRVAAARR